MKRGAGNASRILSVNHLFAPPQILLINCRQFKYCDVNPQPLPVSAIRTSSFIDPFISRVNG